MCALQTNAQDAVFSQFYASSLYLNPALAGEEKDLMFSSNYRSQWQSIVVPYVTSQMSGVYPLYASDLNDRHVGGVGLSMYNDRAGDGLFKTFGFNGSAAYNLPLTSDGVHDLSFGIQFGLIQKNIDYTNLEWGEQYNPYIGFDATVSPGEDQFNNTILYPDIGAGVMYYYHGSQQYGSIRKVSGYLGAAVYHINQPNESLVRGMESRLPRLYKVHGGLEYNINSKNAIQPTFLAMSQNGAFHMNTGMYWSHEVVDRRGGAFRNTNLVLGGWYRYGDAFTVLAGMANERLSLGISYDYNTSSLRHATRGRGGYEISLTIRRVKDHGPRRIGTPRF